MTFAFKFIQHTTSSVLDYILSRYSIVALTTRRGAIVRSVPSLSGVGRSSVSCKLEIPGNDRTRRIISERIIFTLHRYICWYIRVASAIIARVAVSGEHVCNVGMFSEQARRISHDRNRQLMGRNKLAQMMCCRVDGTPYFVFYEYRSDVGAQVSLP